MDRRVVGRERACVRGPWRVELEGRVVEVRLNPLYVSSLQWWALKFERRLVELLMGNGDLLGDVGALASSRCRRQRRVEGVDDHEEAQVSHRCWSGPLAVALRWPDSGEVRFVVSCWRGPDEPSPSGHEG